MPRTEMVTLQVLVDRQKKDWHPKASKHTSVEHPAQRNHSKKVSEYVQIDVDFRGCGYGMDLWGQGKRLETRSSFRS